MSTTTLCLWIGVVAAVSYLLGSLNFAVILSRAAYHDDIRSHGSGSAGMTNMLRVFGKKAAFWTALGDFAKTVLAVMGSRWLFSALAVSLPLDAGYVAGLFALLGHAFPLYFRFKGGKGVITTLSIMLCVNPVAFLIIAVVFIIPVFFTRIVSLSSVLGAIAYPFITWALLYFGGREPLYDTIFASAFSVMVLFFHRENIKRLLTGTEPRLGSKK